MIVPICDADETLWSVEFIDGEGEKEFLYGGKKKGGSYVIGAVKDVLAIAEGFATAASVYEATGYAAACAFDAGNLPPVAQALRAKYPDSTIIIVGDNDENETGRRAAKEAADAVGGVIAIPEQPGMDWNDVALHQGLEAVRAGIEAALDNTLHEEPAPDPEEAAFDALVQLSPIAYGRVRKAEAKKRRVPVTFLDREIQQRQARLASETETDGRLVFVDVEPADEPVDGPQLMTELTETLARYVVIPPHALDAVALWVIRAHAHDLFDVNRALRSSRLRCDAGKQPASNCWNPCCLVRSWRRTSPRRRFTVLWRPITRH